MFSFAIKRGVSSPTFKVLKRIVPSIRHESSSAPATTAAKKVTDPDPEKTRLLQKFESEETLEITKSNQENMARFEECREIFYGPERDYENFPTPKMRETYAPLKHDIIPLRWFDLLYNKSGVAGPYVLGGSALMYLFSKELICFDPDTGKLLAALVAISFVAHRKFMVKVCNSFQGIIDKEEDLLYKGPIRRAKEYTDLSIKQYKQEIDYMKNEDFVDNVYEENLGLMLEAEYRKRLSTVHYEVKRRLDYQLELHNTRRRFEQDHMVNWITGSVLKSITPQLEKDSIKSCIATLNSLAKTQKAAV